MERKENLMEKEKQMQITPEMIANMAAGNVSNVQSLSDIFINNMKGKSAIVTGGASGLGYNVVNRLSEAGVKVVIASRNEKKGKKAEEEFRSRGREVTWCQTDVTKVSDCYKTVEFTEKTYGKVDILVANAATWSMFSFLDMPEEEYDKVMNTDLKGEYFMAQAAARSMVRNKIKGKIIFTSSAARHSSDVNGIGMMSHYNAAKGAIASMTMGVAKELRQYGITVNCVAPGGMVSEGTLTNTGKAAAYYGKELIQEQMALAKDTPTAMNPDEVAIAVFAMCTDMSNYMVGETVDVTGGATLSFQKKPWSYTMPGCIPGPKTE